MNKLTQTISALSLAAGLNACAKPSLPENPTTPDITQTQETIEAHVRRICAEQGFGKHETDRANFECFDPYGIYVIKPHMTFDLPKAKKLTLADIPEFVKGKRAVIFGEEHGNYVADNEFLIQAIPALKAEGFTHIGLEDHYKFQEDLDKSLQDDNDESYSRVSQHFEIAKAAKKNGLKPVLIDHRQNPPKEFYDFARRLDTLNPQEKLKLKELFLRHWNSREDRIFARIEQLLADENVRLVIFFGANHALTKKDIVPAYEGDSQIESTIGHRLKKKYGDQSVSIDLTGCNLRKPVDISGRFDKMRWLDFRKYSIDACVDSEKEVAEPL